MTFNVNVEPSGRSFSVKPDETILAAGISQGISLPYGCKDGACGSCKCKKLSGTVMHRAHQSKALTDDEEAAGFVLPCCAVALSDITLESRQVTRADAFAVKKMPARVLSLARKSHDVIEMKLQLPANDVMQYHAGQFVEFILRDGARRSYSMAIAPHLLTASGAPVLELHLRHMTGGKFTDHVFGAMKEKDITRIEGPFGSFYLRESEKPIILLASGTGFAPIKALIEHLQFKCITRETVLYWGGRRPEDLYMDAWARSQAAALSHLRYVPVISDALPQDNWTGRTGFVHQAVMQDFPDLSGHQVYACGAPIVVESAQKDFVSQCKLPVDEFYADSFTSEHDKHRDN